MIQRMGHEQGMGETAVDGLLAGLAAGAAMVLFLLVVGLAGGVSLATTLGYFDPAQNGNWLNGLLGHLAVSGVYGAGFGLLWRWVVRLRPAVGRYTWLLGVVYGVVLLGVARGVLLRTVEAGVGQIAPLPFALGHLVYGAVVGRLVNRK